MKEKIINHRQEVQRRLVVWVVLTICLQVVAMLTGWQFVEIVSWLAAAFCIILIVIWCYLEWRLLHLP